MFCSKLAEEADMPRENVRRLLMKMLANGEILRAEPGHYVHPSNAALLNAVGQRPETI
jgi:DNA-binding IclR family transcriptional regulator